MRIAYLAAALSLTLVAGCNSSFSVENDSDVTINEVHITGINDPDWGPNVVPGGLAPGESVDIDAIDCGHYDVLVVDNVGDQCTLSDEDICFSNDVWVIDNATLATCAF